MDILHPVTILDMPCVIEANKTIDYKNLYKSSDISQMMFVHSEDFKLKNEGEIESFDPFKAKDPTFNKIVWKKDYDHRYKCRNGLSKNFKNIKGRRFKTKIKYNPDEILDVAKKIKHIIDNGSSSLDNKPNENVSVSNFHENLTEQKSVMDQSAMNVDLTINTDNKKNTKDTINNNNINNNIGNSQIININLENKPTKPSNNNLILNLNDIINNHNNNQMHIDNKEDVICEIEKEYLILRDEYKKLKEKEASGKENDEDRKYRKKVKKKLKHLKSQKRNLNDNNSQKSKSEKSEK